MAATQKPSPIPEVFDHLRAEREGTWLRDVYVPPDDFLSVAGPRSYVVFGDNGAGKTALRIALQRQAKHRGEAGAPLGVHWIPTQVDGEARDIVQEVFKQLMDACARELLDYAYRYPDRLRSAKPWAQQATAWFTQTYLRGNFEFELDKLDDQFEGGNIEGVKALLSQSSSPILPANSPAPSVIAQLASTVRSLGADGIRIYVDGMEALAEQDKAALVKIVKAILSTLALFEEPGFTFKMLTLSEIKNDLLKDNSALRRRWDVYGLKWSSAQLRAMVEKRAQAALGKGAYQLKDLYAPEELLDRLEKIGGGSPRGWLELIRPLLEHQQAKKESAPLSSKEFAEACAKNPPPLRIDLHGDKVYIGYGEVHGLQPLTKKILYYVYAQENRACTREELYYKANLGLDRVPASSKDDNWVGRPQWEKSVDTAVYRIRQVIEPNPKQPIYLITDAGKSIVRLENTW